MRKTCKSCCCVLLVALICSSLGISAAEEVRVQLDSNANPADYLTLTPNLTENELKSFEQRAAKGDALAMDILFFASFAGYGVQVNTGRARYLCEKACRAGGPVGILFFGLGIEGIWLKRANWDDLNSNELLLKSKAYFEPIAQSGNSFGMLCTGLALSGLGQNSEAETWYRKAAEKDCPFAQAILESELRRRGNYTEALKWARKSAEANDSFGQIFLATEYLCGKATAINVDLAKTWLVRAANHGNSTAQYMLFTLDNSDERFHWIQVAAQQDDEDAQMELAIAYRDGIGVKPDPSLSLNWMRKAAENGEFNAAAYLTHFYLVGPIPTRSRDDAVRWGTLATRIGRAEQLYAQGREYLKTSTADSELFMDWISRAATLENSDAQIFMGTAISDGKWIETNKVRAFQLVKQAAQNDYNKACKILGEFCERGEGTPVDLVQASHWYLRAVDNGNTETVAELKHIEDHLSTDDQVAFGVMYWQGNVLKEDAGEAEKWFRKAADHGDSDGQLWMGHIIYDGTAESAAASLTWYRKSAANGNARALYCIGQVYESGRGVEKDYTAALQWYRKASEANVYDAEYAIGVMYELGHGVETNYKEALQWFNTAAKHGSSQAQRKLVKKEDEF